MQLQEHCLVQVGYMTGSSHTLPCEMFLFVVGGSPEPEGKHLHFLRSTLPSSCLVVVTQPSSFETAPDPDWKCILVASLGKDKNSEF